MVNHAATAYGLIVLNISDDLILTIRYGDGVAYKKRLHCLVALA